ncbi:MAG TPA: PepSY domain-containing protein [Verrucomicrobiae bacterium]|nr:PepSY domain-containing protein [Verrucomicrobiae bacterium]
MTRFTITTTLCLGLAAGLLAAGCASEDEKGEKGEKSSSESQLRAQAKISKEDAEAIAMAKVPNGTIKESELEKENGHLQWSFDMTVPDRKDITEVNIDAMTGDVLNIGHEAPDAD